MHPGYAFLHAKRRADARGELPADCDGQRGEQRAGQRHEHRHGIRRGRGKYRQRHGDRPDYIVPAPDLTVAKSHTGSFTQGQTGATYTITVSNSGTGPSTAAVTVADTLPTGLTATAISGAGWTCTLGTLSCTRSDVLTPGGNYPLTVTVNVASNAPASVTNTATVSGGGEVNTANDTATDPTTSCPRPT